MDKEEIFEMVIREMTENALSCRRENLEELVKRRLSGKGWRQPGIHPDALDRFIT